MSSDGASSAALEQVPPSPEYVPNPMELEDHVLLYILEPISLEYLSLSDDDIIVDNQPLPVDASPVALSPGYIADSDTEEDEEDPEEDPTNYPTDGGDDDDDESSDDDDDDDDEKEDKEEREHLAPANSTVVSSLAIDHAPSAEEIEPFETDESAATPPLPPTYRTASRMYVRPQTPIPFPSEAEVDRLLALPTPPPSLLTPLSSPLP
ncbi:hypothetical protein Tco_1511366 [Tanacetum coccineum]